MMIVKVMGAKQVVKRLHMADKMGQAKFIARLGVAGRFLQRESQKIVPVDKTNLKGSAYTRVIPKGWKSDAIVGYTAKYAVYVHEDLNKAHGAAYNNKYAKQIAAKVKGFKRKKPEEQAKFLERPARLHRRTILKILAGWPV